MVGTIDRRLLGQGFREPDQKAKKRRNDCRLFKLTFSDQRCQDPDKSGKEPDPKCQHQDGVIIRQPSRENCMRPDCDNDA
jgi:hypothetical protein